MPDQTFNLNIKAHDQGWEGKQSQLWTCAECSAQSNNPGGHSNWHDAVNGAIQQAINLANQGIQAAAQEAGRAQGVEANLQAQINTKT
jgi:hypothetical protein